MMQVTIDQIVHVVAVRDLVVATSWAVNVPLSVPGTAVRRRAGSWIRGADLEGALVDMPVVRMMQVTVVEVVDVVTMANGGVTAGWTVDMVVIQMGAMRHDVLLSAALGGACARAASL